MVMVSGAIGLQKKGGRSPPPKRGRLGGGRCAAAPYKHRLAHDPGGRRPSGRAFRCVGVLGQRPKRVLVPFTRVKGTPRRVGVLIKSIIRLAPPEVITDFLTSAPVRRTKTPPTIPAGGAVFAYVISSSRTARALHRWCAGYGAPGGCPARPNTPRTAPSPRGSRGSCAGSWPHLRYTGPPRARNADR